MSFGDFHDRIDHSDHSLVSASLHTREITMLSLSKSPSNFNVYKVRAKETRKKGERERKIKRPELRIKEQKETSHRDRIRAAPDKLQGSNARKIQFSLCDLQLPVVNKVSFARKRTLHARGHICIHISKKKFIH